MPGDCLAPYVMGEWLDSFLAPEQRQYPCQSQKHIKTLDINLLLRDEATAQPQGMQPIDGSMAEERQFRIDFQRDSP
jgi:hypothetical protein